MARCGACAQRANAATNTPASPVMVGADDGRLRRVQVRAALPETLAVDPEHAARLTPGSNLYVAGEHIDALIATGVLALI